jgi:ribosome-associated protein
MPLRIAEGIEIPDEELTFTASRSGGPGGQHVNKTASKVTLRFDVAHAPCLPEDVRERLLQALGARVGADGTVRVVSQASRSQYANRRAAEARLAALLARALVPVAPRTATKVPRAQKRRRIESKKRRGAIKRSRTTPADDDRGR